MSLQSLAHGGGWHTPEVARAQFALTEQELFNDMDGKPNAPFREFRRALDWLKDELPRDFTLFEVGCGIGHYSVICARYVPYAQYFGTDASPAMIEIARLFYRGSEPRAFQVSDWSQNDYSRWDVILVSQMAEMTDDPPAVIEFILARAKHFVILHRLRDGTAQGKMGRVYEPTYCGYTGQNWLWDMNALAEMIARYGMVCYDARWERSATLIVEKMQ